MSTRASSVPAVASTKKPTKKKSRVPPAARYQRLRLKYLRLKRTCERETATLERALEHVPRDVCQHTDADLRCVVTRCTNRVSDAKGAVGDVATCVLCSGYEGRWCRECEGVLCADCAGDDSLCDECFERTVANKCRPIYEYCAQ
jgi:hypothetical protein